MLPLVMKAARNDGLQMDDLYRCPTDDQVDSAVGSLGNNWAKEETKSEASFARALFRTYARNYILPFAVFTFEASHLIAV